MSKKLGKFLILTAAVSTAAAAAAVYYMRKKADKAEICEEDLEDVADITEDSASRSYVSLGKEAAEESCCTSSCPDTSVIEECTDAPVEETIEKTEEFFGSDAE